MRRIRVVLLLVFAGLVLTGYLTLRILGVVGPSALVKAKSVPQGHQEIAYIHTATSGPTWERFVAGVRRIRDEWPELEIDDGNAFPDQTAAVPEIALGFKGCGAKLWVRWYKMTSEVGIQDWITELAGRDPPPLAIIGGGSSDRARDLAQALANQQQWQAAAPLLLITTATADQVYQQDANAAQPEHRPLMGLYPGRSFRFCFTNRQMAEAVCDFTWSHADLWSFDSCAPSLAGTAMAVGGDLWGCLTPLALGRRMQLPDVRLLEWADDPYSTDLSAQFRDAVNKPPGYDVNSVESFTLLYSVGGYYRPNPSEAGGIKILAEHMAYAPDSRQLLVLPAMEKPARRILRGLTATAPLEVRNVVAVSGDSISFNIIYRDRDIAWNIQDMPVPLVFFCHQNPVAWPAAPPTNSTDRRSRFASSTDDELLNADIARLILEAAFRDCPGQRNRGYGDGGTSVMPQMLASSDALAERLHQRQPAFFSADGNRCGGSGEYIVCLRPQFEGGRVLTTATIEVWLRQAARANRSGWLLVKTLTVDYAEMPREGGGAHGDF